MIDAVAATTTAPLNAGAAAREQLVAGSRVSCGACCATRGCCHAAGHARRLGAAGMGQALVGRDLGVGPEYGLVRTVERLLRERRRGP